MAGVGDDGSLDIARDEFEFRLHRRSIRMVAADREDGHAKFPDPRKQRFVLFGVSRKGGKLAAQGVVNSARQHARGCLLLSANLERETGDAVIAQFLRENQSAVEQIFAQAIAEEQTSGELSKALNPEALATFFAVTIQGMRAMARLKSDRRALRQVAKLALAALDAK